MSRNRRSADKHGYVVIDKPGGWTSHDVVGRVRRILGERRVGHAGTLDPAATGVLPIAVGLATRTVEYLADGRKSYRAEITFGIETDSADGDGLVISGPDPVSFSLEILESAVKSFLGPQLQIPPMHSAVKVDGQRLYELARKGEIIEVDPRPIEIFDIMIDLWDAPVAIIDIVCSKGTYVRSIARDLGRMLGSGAYLSNLVRTSTGPFDLADAVTLEELSERVTTSAWSTFAFHPDMVLQERSAVVLDAQAALDWSQGKTLMIACESGVVRVYDTLGRWLGVGMADTGSGTVRPEKVINTE